MVTFGMGRPRLLPPRGSKPGFVALRRVLSQGVAEDEQRRVFNVGIGMCAVVPTAPEDATVIGVLA
mgnify:CR=1 FL=1